MNKVKRQRAPVPQSYCPECGAETELDCICDDLNFADGERIRINGEVYVRESD